MSDPKAEPDDRFDDLTDDNLNALPDAWLGGCVDRWAEMKLAEVSSQHRLRGRQVVEILSPTTVKMGGREFVQFASNNYLGLTHHPRVVGAISMALSQGAGSGSAALVLGHTALHAQAEHDLARWKGTQDALVLPSGYQANLACVQTLARLGAVRFLCDKLCHASLIDAVRGSGKEFRIWPHNNLRKLERLLTDAPANQMQVVVTESVFSMDGDEAPLVGLVELKKRFGCVLMVDEAHASGVIGASGRGLAHEAGVTGDIDIFIVTLGKAIGCSGGAICGSRAFCESVVNFGRAYFFTTSGSPAILAGVSAAIGVMETEPVHQQALQENIARIRGGLNRLDWSIPAGRSAIVPIVVGDEAKALALSEGLRLRGILVPAIRPPTVGVNGSRLRVTVSAAHSLQQIDRLLLAMDELRGDMRE